MARNLDEGRAESRAHFGLDLGEFDGVAPAVSGTRPIREKVAEEPQPCVHRELCSREQELDRSTIREVLVGPKFGKFEECPLFALPRCIFAVANILPEGVLCANQTMRIVATLTAVPLRDIQPVVGGD